MPWTSAQHRLFEAAAHSGAVAKSAGIQQQEAATMASEDVKRSQPNNGKAMAAAIRKRR